VRAPPEIVIPVRGIIRGRWDVCCYDITFAPAPALFAGPPITFAPQSVLRAYPFEGGILDGLPPDVASARPVDITEIQERAESLVGQAFRERIEGAALTVPRINDIARVNRAEGLALGAAARARVRSGVSADARVRFGFSDDEWKGELGLTWWPSGGRAMRVFVLRDYVDVRDVPETSGIRNSIAAQEFGSDYTDPIDVRAAGVQVTLGRWARTRWRIEGAYEGHEPLIVRATPENGRYEPLLPARPVEGTRVSLRGDGATWRGNAGILRAGGELRLVDYDAKAVRAVLIIDYERALGASRITARTIAAGVSAGSVPEQLGVYFGGPVTAPGYRFDDFAARRGVSQRVEWRTQVPFIPIPLARFGRVPGKATLAPFFHAVWVDAPIIVPGMDTPPEPTPPYVFRGERQGWYTSVGAGFEPLMGLVRLDVARGLRDGRWTFSFDVSRSFWALL
jgi:hypothetical protein